MAEIDPLISIVLPAAITLISFSVAILIYRHFSKELDKKEEEENRRS